MKGKKGPSGLMMFVSGALTAVGFIGALQRKGKKKLKSDTSIPSEEPYEESIDTSSMSSVAISKQDAESVERIDAHFSDEPDQAFYADTQMPSDKSEVKEESIEIPSISPEDVVLTVEGIRTDEEIYENADDHYSTNEPEEGLEDTYDDWEKPEVEENAEYPSKEIENTKIDSDIEYEIEASDSDDSLYTIEEADIEEEIEDLQNYSEEPDLDNDDSSESNASEESFGKPEESIDGLQTEDEQDSQFNVSITNDEEIDFSVYGFSSFEESKNEEAGADDHISIIEEEVGEVNEIPAASFEDDYRLNEVEDEQIPIEQSEEEVLDREETADLFEESNDENLQIDSAFIGETASTEAEEEIARQEDFKFNVYGVNQKNDEGENIQALIRKELVLPEINVLKPAYGGLKNKDVYNKLLAGEEVKEVDAIIGRNDISLVREKSSSTPIKVIHGRAGHIGYVPSTYTADISNFLEENPDYDLVWELIGGKFKEIDQHKEKVRINSESYGIEIKLYKKK